MTVTAEQQARAVPQAGIAWYRRKSTRTNVQRAIAFLLLTLGAILFFAPVVWMFSSSLKTNQQVFDGSWIPSPAQWSNYSDAWNQAPFALYFRNTVIVTFFSVSGAVLSSSLVAYAFARLRWPGRDFLF